jgi:hypothetical protein
MSKFVVPKYRKIFCKLFSFALTSSLIWEKSCSLCTTCAWRYLNTSTKEENHKIKTIEFSNIICVKQRHVVAKHWGCRMIIWDWNSWVCFNCCRIPLSTRTKKHMDEPDELIFRTAVISPRRKKLSLAEKSMHKDPKWGTPLRGFNSIKFTLFRKARNPLASFFSWMYNSILFYLFSISILF